MRLAVDLPGVQLKDLTSSLTTEFSLSKVFVELCQLTDQSASRSKDFPPLCHRCGCCRLNNAAANLKFGVLTIKASKKAQAQQVRVNVTEDDEGDTSAAGRRDSMQLNMSAVTSTARIAAFVQAASTRSNVDEDARTMSPP
jgi:hypothetical protein